MAVFDDIAVFLEQLSGDATLVGLDISKLRIGVATASLRHGVTTPRRTLVRAGLKSDVTALQDTVREFGATALIVGLPLLPSGDRGRQAQSIIDTASTLSRSLSLPVFLKDERHTTIEANERLQRSPGRKRRKAPLHQDHFAAAIILDDFISQASLHQAGHVKMQNK
jgi:putative Holliday junction resolvase